MQQSAGVRGFVTELKVQGQNVVHHGWLAEVGTWNEFGLLGGCNGGIDENIVPNFSADIARFAVFLNVDDQPDRTMASVTGSTGFAIRNRNADQPWRSDRRPLSVQGRHRRYEK